LQENKDDVNISLVISS